MLDSTKVRITQICDLQIKLATLKNALGSQELDRSYCPAALKPYLTESQLDEGRKLPKTEFILKRKQTISLALENLPEETLTALIEKILYGEYAVMMVTDLTARLDFIMNVENKKLTRIIIEDLEYMGADISSYVALSKSLEAKISEWRQSNNTELLSFPTDCLSALEYGINKLCPNLFTVSKDDQPRKGITYPNSDPLQQENEGIIRLFNALKQDRDGRRLQIYYFGKAELVANPQKLLYHAEMAVNNGSSYQVISMRYYSTFAAAMEDNLPSNIEERAYLEKDLHALKQINQDGINKSKLIVEGLYRSQYINDIIRGIFSGLSATALVDKFSASIPQPQVFKILAGLAGGMLGAFFAAEESSEIRLALSKSIIAEYQALERELRDCANDSSLSGVRRARKLALQANYEQAKEHLDSLENQNKESEFLQDKHSLSGNNDNAPSKVVRALAIGSVSAVLTSSESTERVASTVTSLSKATYGLSTILGNVLLTNPVSRFMGKLIMSPKLRDTAGWINLIKWGAHAFCKWKGYELGPNTYIDMYIKTWIVKNFAINELESGLVLFTNVHPDMGHIVQNHLQEIEDKRFPERLLQRHFAKMDKSNPLVLVQSRLDALAVDLRKPYITFPPNTSMLTIRSIRCRAALELSFLSIFYMDIDKLCQAYSGLLKEQFIEDYGVDRSSLAYRSLNNSGAKISNNICDVIFSYLNTIDGPVANII
jgi:hypothetical protein